MTWMIIRLLVSLAFVGGLLWFAARMAQKRGLGQANGLVEVVARQRMGRSSTVNVVRIADRVLVVGATEESVTLLAEIDGDAVEATLADQQAARAVRLGPDGVRPPARAARSSAPGALAGTVFDRGGWASFVQQLRDRTVRR